MAVRRREKRAVHAGHEHPAAEDPGGGRKATLDLKVDLKLPRALRRQTGLFLFNELDQPLCHCQLAGNTVKVEVPASMRGRMVTVAAAPIVEGKRPPALEQLRRRGVPVVRVPVDNLRRPIDVGVMMLDPRLFERSCCRVRGRVVRRIQLPDGRTITRPLCNARVVIHEVDIGLRAIISAHPARLAAALERVNSRSASPASPRALAWAPPAR